MARPTNSSTSTLITSTPTTTIPTTSSSSSSSSTTQQWLLPSSLKLRNLQSISLRNLRLSLSSSSSKNNTTTTTTTADDDSLPLTLHSPAKLLALKEEATTLHHARSHSDLRGNGVAVGGEDKLSTRPQVRRLRRRSTMEWTNATPQTRQRKLEAATRERIGDVFFSLHVQSISEPVYVSEMVERTMNPTFGTIDWSGCGAGILREEEMVVKVWARGSEGWMLLVQVMVDLRGLVLLGKNLASVNRSLPPNALIFHLPDGVYIMETSPFSPLHITTSQQKTPRSDLRPRHPKSTSTFDAILRLQKLTDTIQDALETRDQIAQDLEHLLLSNKQALTDRDTFSVAQDRLKTIEYAKLTLSKQLDKARAQQAEKRASLSERREFMSTSLTCRKTSSKEMEEIKPTFPSLRDQHHQKEQEIQSQRRRICSDLQSCYPISSASIIPHKPLSFTIRGLHLPHAEDLDSLPPEEVSAALGNVAHLLQLLSFYLGRVLPYPLTLRGSTSTIFDPVGLLSTTTGRGVGKKGAGDDTVRRYPLFNQSVPRFRFEYAVFLIGWDVRVLLEEAWGVRVEDSRDVLGNLKLCLVVATEGEGEVVGRKFGGVRGLLAAGRMRRGSEGSEGSGSGSGVKMLGNGRGVRGARERLREVARGEGLVF